MFSAIAPTYDLVNRLLSAGRDRAWRKAAARTLDAPAGGRVLDLCAGTADLAIAIAGRGAGVLVCADFSLEMLALARRKAERRRGAARFSFVGADGLALPFRDASFDGAGIAFGLRNLQDRAQGLAEIRRVLKPLAPLVVLEFSRPPDTALGRIYRRYLRGLMPRIGQAISRSPDRAYRYLAETIGEFPTPEETARAIGEAGFRDVRLDRRTFGVVAIHRGVRAT